MRKIKQNLDLKTRVREYILQNQLILPRKKVVVAVSGGPDSVCLLHILLQLREDLNINLHIAHLNHQLRGEESEADARYVLELAARLDLPASIEKRDIPGYQAEHRLSLEEAAREVRYGFLAGIAESVGADLVAVGHTQNDQVETILLHIIRGTGTRGLRGLQASQTLKFNSSKLQVIRPLLEIKREETEEYCRSLQIQPRLDSSNLSLSLLRNRVRRELLPLLKNYNQGISDALLRISSIARDDLAFLEAESLQTWKKVVRKQGNTLVFDKKGFNALSIALQRQLLRMAIDSLLGTLKDIETRHIEEILEALPKPAGRQISLPEGLVFSLEYNRYLLSLNPQELNPFPVLAGDYELKLPGVTDIAGWTIKTSIQSTEKISAGFNQEKTDNFFASFDKDSIGNNIVLRSRRRGDNFQPLGMTRFKKVGEFMLDARIPRSWRDSIPIICTPEKIIWIAGYRIDERVKVTPETKQILNIRLIKVPSSSSL
jgi:tRNA(Ile)-lysidine synthase